MIPYGFPTIPLGNQMTTILNRFMDTCPFGTRCEYCPDLLRRKLQEISPEGLDRHDRM